MKTIPFKQLTSLDSIVRHKFIAVLLWNINLLGRLMITLNKDVEMYKMIYGILKNLP
jgi:hypothetical protein